MYVLSRFLFAILLVALALLTLLRVALALAIHVLRTLCGLLVRLLIAILLARLLIRLIFIFHRGLSSFGINVSGALKDWMEKLARILSEKSGAALEFECCGIWTGATAIFISTSSRMGAARAWR
jgi:hypothetical protein